MKRCENYEGGCPECGQTDGFLNIGPNHYFVCHAHRVKWHVGSNLFSCWEDEDEDDWRANADLLSQYREVEPLSEGEPVGRSPLACLLRVYLSLRQMLRRFRARCAWWLQRCACWIHP